jgi:iduronate 2-sulfatase
MILYRMRTTLLSAGLLCLPLLAPATNRPNVLLLLVDDLKPALGCYGDTAAKTPNLDALAARGMRFDLAYCNQAVCAPSRFTLMLGSHSTSTGLYGLGSHLRQAIPNAVTMPQFFAKHGYRTESLGKVFHVGHGNNGDPDSFSVPHFKDLVIEYVDAASTDGGKLTREEALFTNQRLNEIKSLPRGAAFEAPDVDDEDYADGRVANETIRRLVAAKQLRTQDRTPFFITAGFVRPHLPFSAPKKYWDLHDPTKLPQPEFEKFPAESPAVAGKRGGEITAYKPVPVDGEIGEALKRELIHGYYASTSFVDAQIGKVLKAVTRLGLADDTIIVLWGDHGFHLGDLGIWTKHTNYEQANHIPIIIVAPGVTRPGSATRQLAESVDIYPTLAELAGLPKPKGPQSIDGVSLVPTLKDASVRVRGHAFHAYPKGKLGRAIRTERYRLVEWRNPDEPVSAAQYELYDYQADPLETRNHAATKPEIVKQLSATLATYPKAKTRSRKKRKNTKKSAAVVESPRIAKMPLKVVVEVKVKTVPQGVVIAQGGREHGYAIHFVEGKAAFDVRVNGKVTRIIGEKQLGPSVRLEGVLDRERMSFMVNGEAIGTISSPGLIPVQPTDDLSVGLDTESATGNYSAPNPFNGTILLTRVDAGGRRWKTTRGR